MHGNFGSNDLPLGQSCGLTQKFCKLENAKYASRASAARNSPPIMLLHKNTFLRLSLGYTGYMIPDIE